MKKAKALLRYVAISGGLMALVLYGGVTGAEWAKNIAVFATWAFLILVGVTGGILFLFDIATDALKKKGEPYPEAIYQLPPISVSRGVDLVVDVSIAVAMAYFGWIVTALVYTVHTLVSQLIVWNSMNSLRAKGSEPVKNAIESLVKEAGGR